MILTSGHAMLSLHFTLVAFGAAFAFEAANKTWQRMKTVLDTISPGVTAPYGSGDPNPGIAYAFKILKTYLAQMKGSPDMQMLAFAAADLSAASGTALATGAARIVAVYVSKTGAAGTGNATAAYFKIHDDATVDTTASEGKLALPLLAANDARVYIDPQGILLANGLVVNADTTIEGTTDSATADCGPGFVLVANF